MNVRSDNGIKRPPDAIIGAGADTIGITEHLRPEPYPGWMEMELNDDGAEIRRITRESQQVRS